jgi:hypothetical protein
MVMQNKVAVLTLAIFLGVGMSSAMADRPDGKGHGHGNPHAKHFDGEDHDWEQRGKYEYRVYDGDHHPPGWSHGKKTGWGDCGMPPGQAKKYGCRTYVENGRQVYAYQDNGGRIIVRRPVINIHGGIEGGIDVH